MSERLKAYYKACNDIAEQFSKKYSDGDYYYIGDDVGGMCNTGDIYLDTHDMAMVLKENPTLDRFLDAYYEWTDTQGKDCNLYNLVRYGVKQMKAVGGKK